MPQENKTPHGQFKTLLECLVRVPKHEIDAQEMKYQKEREALKQHPAKKPA